MGRVELLGDGDDVDVLRVAERSTMAPDWSVAGSWRKETKAVPLRLAPGPMPTTALEGGGSLIGELNAAIEIEAGLEGLGGAEAELRVFGDGYPGEDDVGGVGEDADGGVGLRRVQIVEQGGDAGRRRSCVRRSGRWRRCRRR